MKKIVRDTSNVAWGVASTVLAANIIRDTWRDGIGDATKRGVKKIPKTAKKGVRKTQFAVWSTRKKLNTKLTRGKR